MTPDQREILLGIVDRQAGAIEQLAHSVDDRGEILNTYELDCLTAVLAEANHVRELVSRDRLGTSRRP